ncbi:MAG: hypothetical protein GY788_27975 [bacterium]|nr:hypothetical protein [bacterium]
MTPDRTSSSDRLYRLLPEVYRDRDRRRTDGRPGEYHLRRYISAFGNVLDLIRNTLDQRYDDCFPDTSVVGHRCQDWLVPYFADLFAVALQSPYAEGQRAEVANAVRWAQRKGTLQSVEEIVEAITQVEGEVQEGWKRVATTARIGMPVLPAIAFGESESMAPDPEVREGATAQEIARHPGIPAVTPDLRKNARAVAAEPGTPGSHMTRFGWNGWVWPQDDPAGPPDSGRGVARSAWRQANRHGAPCFPDTYEDVSLRTVDVRHTDQVIGSTHPKRLIVFLPPPFGLCTPDPFSFAWSENLDSSLAGSADPDAPRLGEFVSKEETSDGIVFRNHTPDSVEITGTIDLDQDRRVRFEKLRFSGEIRLSDGIVEFRRCAVATLSSTAPAETASTDRRIDLRDSLVGSISAPANRVTAEYVTVLGDVEAAALLASDSIFAKSIAGLGIDDCIRFSRVPSDYFALLTEEMRRNGNTAAPHFFVSDTFCEPGCGVLRQEVRPEIAKGAEDGGEMGAFHAWRYCAQLESLANKLRDYLPVGIEPVVVRDDRLLCRPPMAQVPA